MLAYLQDMWFKQNAPKPWLSPQYNMFLGTFAVSVDKLLRGTFIVAPEFLVENLL